jgi:hypothetical protein
MRPHSAQVFLDAFEAGASAREMDILLAVLRRDYAAYRQLDAIVKQARVLKHALSGAGISPASVLRIRRAASALGEIG